MEEDELLDGDDDDIQKDTHHDDILANLEIPGKQKSTSPTNVPDIEFGLALQKFNLEHNMDDDTDDSDAEYNESKETAAAANIQSSNDEDKNRKRDTYLSFLSKAPGLNLFNQKEGRHAFKYFDLESLCLEKDFDYARRANLKGRGFSKQEIDEILGDKFTFLRHLMPEAQSILICDKNDFKSIMDFLFYCISVCTERRLSDLMIKCLLDLSKNYVFSWRLSLKHMVTVLKNYDMQVPAYSMDHFKRHLNDAKVKPKRSIEPAKFLSEHNNRKTPKSVSDEKFTFCISRFIQIVCEIFTGLASRRILVDKSDWSDLCFFAFLMNVLATDKRFIEDFTVLENVKILFAYLFDSISSESWHFGVGKAVKQDNNKYIFTPLSFPNILSRMIHDFPLHKDMKKFKNWENTLSDEQKSFHGDHEHHFNMIHKIELLPLTYRGNQTKKFIAFLYLQTLLGIEEIFNPSYPSVDDIAKSEKIMTPTFIKWLKRIGSYPTLLVIVKLCDIIVGYEVGEAFRQEKHESIKKVYEGILGTIENKLPSPQSLHDTEKLKELVQLKSHVMLVKERWNNGLRDAC